MGGPRLNPALRCSLPTRLGRWSVPTRRLADRSGSGVPITSDTGYFWFFNEANVELVVKVLDGRSVNGHFWVFYGGMSSVEYSGIVTDTQTGTQRSYVNERGTPASVADTSAF